MFLITGLGNPGSRYEGTRHNVGFETIDELVRRNHIWRQMRRMGALMFKGKMSSKKVILCKPLTFMNASGSAVRDISYYYGIDPDTELIVISDDINLPVGKLRIREKGSAGGHNGLKDIIEKLDTSDFTRVRIGVGDKPENGDLVKHVLSGFSGEDREIMAAAVQRAADAVEMIISKGAAEAMNEFN